MNPNKLLAFIILIIALMTSSVCFAVPKRFALIMGNAHYNASLYNLDNDINDANDVAAVLKEIYHFNNDEVKIVLDANSDTMLNEINKFGNHIKSYQGEKLVFLYYSGHGVEVDNMPYLVPTDASADNKMQFLQKSVPVKHILMTLGSDKEQSNLIVLDACRSNLFSKAFGIKTKSGNVLGGFDEANFKSINDTLIGTLIATATSSGDTASPEGERNSIYTKNFLKFLREKPDLDIRQLLDDVTIKVLEESNGEQTPWKTGVIKGNFSFASFEPVNNPIPTITTPPETGLISTFKEETDTAPLMLKKSRGPFTYLLLAPLLLAFEENCKTNFNKLKKQAQQGNYITQNLLGDCYYATDDYHNSFKQYLNSAYQGYVVAQYNLGYMYEEGKGVTQDYLIAKNWYFKAANQGYDNAKEALARLNKKQ
ncbi:MAG: caspase family protein [Methylococcaceae bacterium]